MGSSQGSFEGTKCDNHPHLRGTGELTPNAAVTSVAR